MSLAKPAHAGYFFGQSVTALAGRLREGSLTSVGLTQAALDSIERLNPILNAFVQVDAPVALAQARKADELLAKGVDLGPLHGIPVAVKDNIDTFDYVTTYGSAHFNGFKPSFAAVPLEGVFPLSSSLDHVGPIANYVEDARLLFEVLVGRACAPALNPRPLRVGWITCGSFGPVDAEVNRQVCQAAQQLFGEALQDTAQLQPLAADMKDTLLVLQRAEAFEVHAERMHEAPQLFDQEVRERLELSEEVRGWHYIRAQAGQARLKAAMADVFEHYDFLVSPCVPITATEIDAREVRVGEQDIDVRAAVLSHTSAWNLTGLPAISLPVGQVRGMPVGLQVIGAAGADDRLLEVMAKLFVRA